jgi:hypothetical protein
MAYTEAFLIAAFSLLRHGEWKFMDVTILCKAKVL